MPYHVVHVLPGRLRVRQNGGICADFQGIDACLSQIPGVLSVTSSPRTGSLLIYYETEAAGNSVCTLLDLPAKTLPRLTGVRISLPPTTASVSSVPVVSPTDQTKNPLPLPLAAVQEKEMTLNEWCVQLGGTAVSTLLGPFLPIPLRMALAVWNAWPFLKRGLHSLLNGRMSVDVLDATAITISLTRCDFLSVTIVTTLLEIGEALEEWTRKRSYETLAQSLAANVDMVWIRRDGVDSHIHLNDLKPDDRIVVRTGGTLPVDGLVEEGEALVNQASMTGEQLPVLRRTGGMVYAGTTLEEGTLLVKPLKTGDDTRYRQIVGFIERSESLKAEAQSRSEKLAQRMVPVTFVLAGLIWLFTRNARKAASVLLVDYSCALKLVTPLTILSGMREGARYGILVRGGRFLEGLASADTIVFDKTGTLTQACPKVAAVTALNSHSRTEILRLSACLEEHFPHPVARAVVHQAEAENLHHKEEHNEVEYVVAHGVVSHWRGQRVPIGSRHFVHEDEHVPMTPASETVVAEESAKGHSLLYLAIGGELAGIISIEDPLRPEAPAIIDALRAEGIRHIVMLTGDSEATAAAVAGQLGLDEWYSRLLPDDKVTAITDMRRQGRTVVMVGDGLNDAPALSAASVGVAMRDGADLAREVADIVLDRNNLADILVARQLAKLVLRRVNSHFAAIIGLNSIFLGVGLTGMLAPGLAALLHNATTVGTGLSAMRPFLPPPSDI